MDIRFRTETRRIGNFTVTIKRVINLDDLIEQVSDEEFSKDERLPYWAELWPSAIGLAGFLTEHPELVRKKSVLELGVGLGLTSVVLQKLKPGSLLLTDYEPEALEIARENFLLNHLPLPEVRLLDWRKPDLNRTFDCIVASDILYEERFFISLLDLFKKFLRPEGTIVIAEPNRAVAQTFFSRLESRGFVWWYETVTVPEKPKPIRVSNYVIRRK